MKANVLLSNWHNGQNCYPCVTAEWIGRSRVHVELVWIDRSYGRGDSRREYAQAEFTGTVAAAEKWLRSHNVELDGPGIY